MNISPAEALRRFKVSKPTLYSDMNDGKLSYSIDERKRRKINIAELERIYEKLEDDQNKSVSADVKATIKNTESNVNQTNYMNDRMEQEIDFLKRELESKQSETEKWQEAFDKAQSTANKITALLEDRSYNSKNQSNQEEWQKSLKILESRVANQEAAEKDRKDREQKILRQNQALKKALDNEKNKSIWKKLFG